MRTTITLDDDVAALVRRIERSQHKSFKEVINSALRAGLERLEQAPGQQRSRFHTKPMSLGACRIGSIDDVSEVLAVAEGEGFR